MGSNEIEVWGNIPDYEGLYRVSNFGNVTSLPRKKTKGGLLSLGDNGYGYKYVTLSKNGVLKKYKVHVLVSMVFLGHKPNGTHEIVVDHKDNDRSNNRADNLKLITQRENTSKDRKGVSKYTGVSFHKKNNKWQSSIRIDGKLKHLGYFEEEIDASTAYQKTKNQIK